MNRMEHLLAVLAEECAEVAQRCSKAQRFGMHQKQALDGYPPPVVTEWLSAEAKEEGSSDAAIDRMLGNDTEDPDDIE